MNFEELLGKTLTDIKVTRDGRIGDNIIFTDSEGKRYKLYHSQDCCETVEINDICGDIEDLLNYPLTQSEESSNQDNIEGQSGQDESFTWTFYKMATNKGYVTLRWIGSSNGYYSERVDFVELTDE